MTKTSLRLAYSAYQPNVSFAHVITQFPRNRVWQLICQLEKLVCRTMVSNIPGDPNDQDPH
jgi:hypothetical protein